MSWVGSSDDAIDPNFEPCALTWVHVTPWRNIVWSTRNLRQPANFYLLPDFDWYRYKNLIIPTRIWPFPPRFCFSSVAQVVAHEQESSSKILRTWGNTGPLMIIDWSLTLRAKSMYQALFLQVHINLHRVSQGEDFSHKFLDFIVTISTL